MLDALTAFPKALITAAKRIPYRIENINRVGSLPQRLPYWLTLSVPIKPNACFPGAQAPVLVLKDGTVAIGLRVRGLDLHAASNAVLNQTYGALTNALNGLPSDVYLQTVFESGAPCTALIERFAALGEADSHPLLRAGRTRRAERLKNTPELNRCEITYWVGFKEALAVMTDDGGEWFKRLAGPSYLERTHKAAQLLADVTARFMGSLDFGGLQTAVLSETDILDACHRAINPTAYADFPAPRYIETEEDIAAYQAGEPLVGRGPALASQLCLAPVGWNATQLAMGEPPILARAITISRLSKTTTPSSISDVLFQHQPTTPFRLVVTHRATDQTTTLKSLEFRRTLAASFLGKHLTDHAAAKAFADQDRLINDLTETPMRLFDTSVIALVYGHDEHELDQATRDVFDGFKSHNIACGPLHELQLQGWLASLPANGHRAPTSFQLLERSAAHLTPIWQPSEGDPTPELLFENRQRALEGLSIRVGPVREQAGAFILGSTGSGKTFLFSQLLKYGCLDLGGHAVVVDVKGPTNSSLRPLCKLLGGKYISLESDADASFNLFPPHKQVFDDKGALIEGVIGPAILAVCTLALPESLASADSDYWETVAGEAIELAYKARHDIDEPVILQDVIDALASYTAESSKRAGIAADMRDRLQTALDKSPMRRRLFNQRKHLDLSNRFVVFDFGGMEEDPRATLVLMGGLVSHIGAKMRLLPKTLPKVFACDEGWKIFEQSDIGARLFGLSYRTGRSYGVSTYVLTQHEDDIKKNPVGDAILSNSSLRYFLRRIDGHEQVAETFDLTPRQLALFRSLKPKPGPYAEFLLVDTQEKRSQVLQYWPTPHDYWSDTSRPADVELRNKRLEESGLSLVEVIDELARTYPHGAPINSEAGSREVA